MNYIPSLSNTGQLYKMLFFGVVCVPLLGIIPASMPFFVDNFGPDAPIRNPAFRIGLVAVACGIGLTVVWHVVRTSPKTISLGDEYIKIDYLLKSVSRPYSDIAEALLNHRNFTVGGYDSIPLAVDETVFTIRFRNNTKVKVSVVPSHEYLFLKSLADKLQN